MIVRSIYQGDHRTFELTVTDQDGNIVDISDSTIYFTVKESKEKTAYVIQKTFSLTDPTNGIAEVELVPTDTSGLSIAPQGNEYVFDVEIETLAGKINTLLEGKFMIYKGVK